VKDIAEIEEIVKIEEIIETVEMSEKSDGNGALFLIHVKKVESLLQGGGEELQRCCHTVNQSNQSSGVGGHGKRQHLYITGTVRVERRFSEDLHQRSLLPLQSPNLVIQKPLLLIPRSKAIHRSSQ
jgi:hypothetical protein